MAKAQRLCGSCGKWHAPHMPDNTTLVPICPECWKQATVDTRISALSLATVSSRMVSVDTTLLEMMDSIVTALAAKQANSSSGYSEN
jgi:hypothetical protein